MKAIRPSYKKRFSGLTVVCLAAGIVTAADFSWLEAPVNGNWNTTDPNWSGAGALWGNAQTDNADFGSSATQSITADAVTVSNIAFNADGYALGGGPLNLFGNITVSSAPQTATITAPIAHSATNLVLSKLGAGTLVLNPTGAGASNNFASLKAAAGTLHVAGGTNVVNFALGVPNKNPAFWVSGGTLVMGGGLLKTTAGGYAVVGDGGTLLVTNGLADLTSTVELLNAYPGTAGTTTVGGNGILDVLVLRISQNTLAADRSVININTGGTVRLNIFYTDVSSVKNGTVNFNGGTVVAKAENADLLGTGHANWSGIVAYVLEGGAVFETTNKYITVKQALLSGAANDGGLTKKNTGTLHLRGANTYRGGNFVWAGGLNIANDNNLGAVPDAPATNVTFVGNSSLLSGGTHALAANRTIRIPHNVTATFDTQSYTQTVKGVIFGEGTTNVLLKLGTGMLELDPGDASGVSVRTLKTQAGTVHVRSGSNLVTMANGVASSSGFFAFGGKVLVGGGILQTTGRGHATICNGALIVTNGVVDFTSVDELLNAHGGTGDTTVSDSGVLDIKLLRVSQKGAPISANVVNVNTGGTIRLNGFNIDKTKDLKGLINLNGGTLVAKTSTANFLGDGDGKWLTNIFVNVLEGGAVIDTNGKDISVKQSLYAGAAVDGGLTKQGAGTLTLLNTNTYSGTTVVAGGTLKLGRADALPSANTVMASSNAVFDVNGTAQTLAGIGGGGMVTNLGALTVTGIVSPGDAGSCGTLTLAEPPASLSDCALAVNVSTNGPCDRLHVQGDLDLSGLSLSVEDAAQLNPFKKYTVASCTGTLGLPFAAVSPLPQRWQVKYDAGNKTASLVYNFGTVLVLR